VGRLCTDIVLADAAWQRPNEIQVLHISLAWLALA